MRIIIGILLAVSLFGREPLDQRISHTDPSKYHRSKSHAGVGEMACMTLPGADSLNTNLLFMHRCRSGQLGRGSFL